MYSFLGRPRGPRRGGKAVREAGAGINVVKRWGSVSTGASPAQHRLSTSDGACARSLLVVWTRDGRRACRPAWAPDRSSGASVAATTAAAWPGKIWSCRT
eukprot:scaffold443_cov527-Prasinococcus_capsulatus_cf.AAC.7